MVFIHVIVHVYNIRTVYRRWIHHTGYSTAGKHGGNKYWQIALYGCVQKIEGRLIWCLGRKRDDTIGIRIVSVLIWCLGRRGDDTIGIRIVSVIENYLRGIYFSGLFVKTLICQILFSSVFSSQIIIVYYFFNYVKIGFYFSHFANNTFFDQLLTYKFNYRVLNYCS